jgi:L-threonylcarbamoyladenylate synthase
METSLVKIDPKRIDPDLIEKAAGIIRCGGLVAFPTETVYGLGADALNPRAVVKIFHAKKRPFNDPLIVHIADKNDISLVAEEADEKVSKLAEAFWPGPLTLIVRKSSAVPPAVTAGLGTVAVRMPADPVALCLIKASETPIAAPSANLFGRSSPVTAEHVMEDLNGKIDMVLDGGRTSIGVESTILDLTHSPFRILRPGGISLEALRKVLSEVVVYRGPEILSSGMFSRHYSPRAKLILVEKDGPEQIGIVHEIASDYAARGHRVGIMVQSENREEYGGPFNVKILGSRKKLASCAANLFKTLRDFDNDGTQVIVAEGVPEKGLGLAIMDRLRKAAAKEAA